MAGENAREAVIAVRGVVNRFGTQVVHDGLDLDVYRGEILGIVGGSGTGKSVLLRSIVGLNRPAAGSIRVFDVDVLNTSEVEREAVSRRWGVLFQQGALFSALTVQQNVEAPMRELLHIAPHLREALAQLKVSMVGLPPNACDKYPSELSGACRNARAWHGRCRSIPRSSSSTSRLQASIQSVRPPSTI